MDTGLFLSPEHVEPAQLGALVEAIGGEWTREISEGFVHRGNGEVVIWYSPHELELFDDEELAHVVTSFGFPPISAVTLGVMSSVESLEVAYDIVQALKKNWRGVIEWEHEGLATAIKEIELRREG